MSTHGALIIENEKREKIAALWIHFDGYPRYLVPVIRNTLHVIRWRRDNNIKLPTNWNNLITIITGILISSQDSLLTSLKNIDAAWLYTLYLKEEEVYLKIEKHKEVVFDDCISFFNPTDFPEDD